MSVINTNVKALVAQESMRTSNLKLSSAMERLSTGLRINSAKDDAAGLAITNRMTAQVRGMSVAVRNANDGISMAQTADGAYGQVTSMLQRMRELAVQASTGSLSGSDRESIQLEIDELKSEIDSVAKNTSFNGIKLLDGSAKEITLQVGADQGQSVEIGFDSVNTKDIGSGLNPALTSVGGDATKFGALAAGDLTLNGVLVGASLATDDELSYGTVNAASAIAKVAAINRVAAESGVTAKVNSTEVLGASMTAVATSGTISINNVATSSVSVTSDAELSRRLVADAINAISAQTGVRAINTGDDKQGVTLVAEDGRNITVAFATLTAGNTGVAAAATYVGTYSLYSANGSDIAVSHQIGKGRTDFDNTGLALGTFKTGQATVVTTDRAYVTAGTAATGLSGSDLVINGIAINASLATDDTASYANTASTKAASAIAIAAAINKKADQTGVRAVAEANVLRGTGFTAATAFTAFINGVAVVVNSITRDNVLDAINEKSGQTGVVARAYGAGVELVAKDGRNIAIALATAGTAGNMGLAGLTIPSDSTAASDSNVFYAGVRLESDKAFVLERGVAGTSAFENLGFRVGTFGGKDTGTKIAEVDVTSQLGAMSSISAIDSAINDVAAAQAKSGAVQNRLESTLNVLGEAISNASDARSRILDTDYATETTAMAKAQIVQQAATAMLAQANQQPQTVLSLLQ